MNKLDIISESWDILLVLDACRYDYFKKYNMIEGKLTERTSKGYSTPTWFQANFTDYYDNIIYISGNPFISSYPCPDDKFVASERFLYMEDVWDWGWDEIEGIGTVPASSVLKGLDIHLNSGKKLIAHFMQPHSPYVGKTKLNYGSFELARTKPLGIEKSIRVPVVAQLAGDLKLLHEAYRDNLIYVLEEIHKYLSVKIFTDKKVVITSDHGEHLGETSLQPITLFDILQDKVAKLTGDNVYTRWFSHSHSSPMTRQVPWLEVDLG